MMMPTIRQGVGVVVGRFQIDDLHLGHLALLSQAALHERLLVFIGISPYLVTPSDPLDFAAREQMVKEAFPRAIVMPLPDQPTDEGWSRLLDGHIRNIFPLDSVTLYFGRGSSRALYSGRAVVREIDEVHHMSATDIRKSVGKSVVNSIGWRAGVIYAAHNQWQRTVAAVDIAIIRTVEKSRISQGSIMDRQVLLGRRNNEGGVYRFPGGHVDINDANLESAALREAIEETGGNLELSSPPEYIGSYRAKSGSNWTLFTSFYCVHVLFGKAEASDDLDYVVWTDLIDLGGLQFADSHAAMARDLFNHFTKR